MNTTVEKQRNNGDVRMCERKPRGWRGDEQNMFFYFIKTPLNAKLPKGTEDSDHVSVVKTIPILGVHFILRKNKLCNPLVFKKHIFSGPTV